LKLLKYKDHHQLTIAVKLQVDDYLDREDLDASLDDLRTHRLAFTKQSGRVDDMARNVTENVDDYVVVSYLSPRRLSVDRTEQFKFI
jgi:hypothetical protein